MRAQSTSAFWALIAILTLLAMVASALPALAPLGPATIKDEFVVPSWEVAPYPGATPIFLNGTVEQVYAKLLEINPNYDDDWNGETMNGVVEPELETRDVDHKIECLRDIGPTQKFIKAGIRYLRKINGRPHLPAGECSRVSCSYNSAIYWCNDKDHDAYLPSFNNIADGAQVILNICFNTKNDWKRARGILHHPVGMWRTLVYDPTWLQEEEHHC
ncbi:hypothetical protein BJX64DRAFT_286138 [Aspergillus heterothallicus]